MTPVRRVFSAVVTSAEEMDDLDQRISEDGLSSYAEVRVAVLGSAAIDVRVRKRLQKIFSLDVVKTGKWWASSRTFRALAERSDGEVEPPFNCAPTPKPLELVVKAS